MKNTDIPEWLVEMCNEGEGRKDWLAALPTAIADLQQRWGFSIEPPFEREPGPSWAAPVQRRDGTSAVLKLGMPHMEAEHEIAALRFLDGDPTAQLFEADLELNAMLLERCDPGTILRTRPESEQDQIIAKLLPKFWLMPPAGHPFRPLAIMVDHWIEEALADEEQWTDRALVQEGIALFKELSQGAADEVLLATDLHAANVLCAQREPWLVIDPKPFVGDRAYDATQHLLNCQERLRADPRGTIGRFAEMLELECERVRLWTFARVAVDSRTKTIGTDSLVSLLAP